MIKPYWANVLCKCKISELYCYAHKNKDGNIYTGYPSTLQNVEADEDHLLHSSEWEVIQSNVRPIFFANSLNLLHKPNWANVSCVNKKTKRYCYAFQNNQGKLFTGFCFGEDMFQYELENLEWMVTLL